METSLYKAIYLPLQPHGVWQEYIDKEYDIPKGWTDVEPPQPLWKPVFNFKTRKWKETATKEEMQGVLSEEETI